MSLEEDRERKRKTHLSNLDEFELLFYSGLEKRNGKEGKRNSLEAALMALKGPEFLSILRAQGNRSIANENGVNANFDLAEYVDRGTQAYSESLTSLEVKYVTQYIGERIDADVEAKYENKTLEDLVDGSEEEKEYAKYLMELVSLAVEANIGPKVYARRVELATNSYRESLEEY